MRSQLEEVRNEIVKSLKSFWCRTLFVPSMDEKSYKKCTRLVETEALSMSGVLWVHSSGRVAFYSRDNFAATDLKNSSNPSRSLSDTKAAWEWIIPVFNLCCSADWRLHSFSASSSFFCFGFGFRWVMQVAHGYKGHKCIVKTTKAGTLSQCKTMKSLRAERIIHGFILNSYSMLQIGWNRQRS